MGESGLRSAQNGRPHGTAEFELLDLLEQRPDASQREIAAALGMSLGKVNYCLAALADKGLIKIGRFGASRHKLGYVRVLTPQGLTERARLMTVFLTRKIDEYDQLGAQIADIERRLAADAALRSEHSGTRRGSRARRAPIRGQGRTTGRKPSC